ncbi:SPFH domain-containing protein [Mycoplasmopsis cynos]|uniref:Membrane protease subunits, stomatin/prohibitin-like protein n=1 Tax=Mycoplasmopsis cynos TaxID=171284 RepID=A0A449AHM7_9BACT|nr:SPFH domain-containing protein [Mycoplasmopsis cynos]TQC54479.1 SPFH/Band 7/PHB domain protein [Mycoplasmopsis cynos]VEU64491.1 membrane protease subunits, stomatin/prohibitin-like protein [Mycoplasmopsis cynos]
MSIATIIIIVLVFTILLISTIIALIKSIKVIPQSEFAVVERLGKYHKTLKNGINFIVPFIDKIIKKENFKEKVLDFPEQDVITKDNAGIRVDTVVYLAITDPKLFVYGAENSMKAIENLSATTLRNLLGELELDETLTSRDTINSKLTLILDQASDAWGIKVYRVEIKNILPPLDIQNAMEKQMRAEREKRANILDAEGKKAASILIAEGQKSAEILKAEAAKQAEILKAEAFKQAEILKAEGQRKAIDLINEANLSQSILTLKSIEQLEKLANGNATKIIIPPNLSSIASTMSVVSEVLDTKNDQKSTK